MRKASGFAGHVHTPKTKRALALKAAKITKEAWANPNSGLRNRKNPQDTRRARGTVSKLLGKTYEEIYSEEGAKKRRELVKDPKVWRAMATMPREQFRKNSLRFGELLRTNPEFRKKWLANRRSGSKKMWAEMPLEVKNKRIRNAMLAAQQKPNKPETYLQSLLQFLFPNEWTYIGDGELIIAGKNPDFANINGKKQLIDLYGDFWHKGEQPESRISLFRQFGYETLVIWEHELYNVRKLAKKLVTFAEGGQTRSQVG